MTPTTPLIPEGRKLRQMLRFVTIPHLFQGAANRTANTESDDVKQEVILRSKSRTIVETWALVTKTVSLRKLQYQVKLVGRFVT
jgi:hypothetical protein